MKISIKFILYLMIEIVLTIHCTENRKNELHESKTQQLCCTGNIILSPWAASHYKDVRIVGSIMRQLYFALINGDHIVLNYIYPRFGGRSQEEMHKLVTEHVHNLIRDTRLDYISKNVINQGNFFEQEAAKFMEALEEYRYNPPNTDFVQIKNSQQSNFVYPEADVVDDSMHLLKRNCSKNFSEDTITSHQIKNIDSHLYQNSKIIKQPVFDQKSATHSRYDYYKRQESKTSLPHVAINERIYNSEFSNDKNAAVLIPVSSNYKDIEVFDSNKNFQNVSTFVRQYTPSRSISIEQYNHMIIKNAGSAPRVEGNERKFFSKDGQMVYDNYRSFQRQQNWEKQERENLFWFLGKGNITNEDLRQWQLQQEDRLHNLAFRLNKTIEIIEEWQREEIDIYNQILQKQLESTSRNTNEWQTHEKSRIHWLINQNSLNKSDFEAWQKKYEYMLSSLAQNYQISISNLKEWQQNQFDQINKNFIEHTSDLDILKQWQNDERSKLHMIIRQHNITVEDLRNQLTRDQKQLEELSQQYQLNKVEMENWLKTEMSRLSSMIRNQQEEIKRLEEWQKSERYRLEKIVENHNLTVEQLRDQLTYEKNHLNELAHLYHVSIEEIEDWQRQELERLKNIKTLAIEKEIEEWKQKEREKLMLLVQQNNYTIEEFQNKFKQDRTKLQQLATKYKVQVEEIEDWFRNESSWLYSQGLLKKVDENLKEWQIIEKSRLENIITQNRLSVEELEKMVQTDSSYLQNLAIHYHIKLKDVEDWIKAEIQRLKIERMTEIKNLEEWQKIEKENIDKLIKENKLTIEELNNTILQNKNYLQNIAHNYKVDIAVIENFIRNEIIRLQENSQVDHWHHLEREYLNQIISGNQITYEELVRNTLENQYYLEQLANKYEVGLNEIKNFVRNELEKIRVHYLRTNLADWQKTEREKLMKYVQNKHILMEDLTQKITSERHRLETLAYENHINVEEVEEWYKKQIEELLRLGLVYQREELQDWKITEIEYLRNLVLQAGESYEVILSQLKGDETRLRKIHSKYNIAIEEIIKWYENTLYKMFLEGLILKQWQIEEKNRLHQIARSQQYTVSNFEKLIWQDNKQLFKLAKYYLITITELKDYQVNVIKQLVYAGLFLNNKDLIWEEDEYQRLKYVAENVKISREELKEFLEYDREFNLYLCKTYNATMNQLESVQYEALKRLQYETDLLDNTKLLHLEYWQKRERDRLFNMLMNEQNINIERVLIEWQNSFHIIENLAKQYNISVGYLKEWQLNELNRLKDISRHFNISLQKLAQFRQHELENIKVIAHVKDIAIEEFSEWKQQEEKQLKVLENTYRMSKEKSYEFSIWRRILFLLCQGFIDVTLLPSHELPEHQIEILNADRGDQPPNVTIEDYDLNEPNVIGHPSTTAPIQERQISYIHVANVKNTYDYNYQKKVTTYPGPVGHPNTY